MKFRCEAYPALLVHVPVNDAPTKKVRFDGGELETDDADVIAHLSAVAKDGDGSIIAEKPKAAPKKKAAKPKAEPKTPAEPIPGQTTVEEQIADAEKGDDENEKPEDDDASEGEE